MVYDEYFIERVSRSLCDRLRFEGHVCGLCEHWRKYDYRDDYGDCMVNTGRAKRKGLGYDCSIGCDCRNFKAARKLVLTLEIKGVD